MTMQYLDCRSGCIAQSEGQACPGVCVSIEQMLLCQILQLYVMYILQSGRCQGICGSNLGCFGSSVENNGCGVDCKVSVIILHDLHQTQEGDTCSNRKVIAVKVVSDSQISLHVRLYVADSYLMLTLYTYIIPTTAGLPKPLNPPVLTRLMDNQEIYDIGNLSEIETELYDNPSLLFQIEDQSQPGEYVYQWMMDVVFDLPEITVVEYILNLNTFTGRSLNIAYAFATDMGLSEYSESAIVDVLGK